MADLPVAGDDYSKRDLRSTSTEVSPTSTGDRYVRIEGRLGDDENTDVEWAALGFIYAIGVLSFAAARPRGVSGMHFEAQDQWTAALQPI